MSQKSAIWLGMVVGSFIGSLIGGIFSTSVFSFQSIILEAVGGILGIWIMFKLTHE
jgi:hypothetical protein